VKVLQLLFAGGLAIASPLLIAEPTYISQTPVSFGQVLGITYSDCSFNNGGSGLTGTACLESSGIPGEIRITGLANTSYTVTLFPPAAPSNGISFQPRLANGSASITVVTDAEGHCTVDVGGTLTTGGIAPTPGAPTSFVYTVRINRNE